LAAATVLTPAWGVYGVIVAGFIAQAVDTILFRRLIDHALGTRLPLMFGWRLYPCSLGAGLAAFAFSLLPLHPILLTLGGGFVFLLVLVPLLALCSAVTEQDIASLEVYFGGVRPLSALLGLLVGYYRMFRKTARARPFQQSSQ